MHPVNESALDTRYRIILILWFALFSSIAMLFLLAILITPGENVSENMVMSLTFVSLGTLSVIASYFVKQRFLAQAVAKQDVALVQTGTIVAAALCEVAAMLALIDLFMTGNQYYYLLMIVAIIGTLLNFPRRDHLLAASYQNPESEVMG